MDKTSFKGALSEDNPLLHRLVLVVNCLLVTPFEYSIWDESISRKNYV